MSFKQISKIVLVLPLILFGCDRYLGKENKKTEVVDISPKEFSCLSTWPAKAKAFLLDESNDKDIEEIFSCLDQTLTTFAKFTKGSQKELYSSVEMQYYLNRYLMVDQQLTENIMQQLMRVKAFLFGGTIDQLTRVEIESMKKYLLVMKKQAFKLKGNLKIVFFQAKRAELDEAKVSAALEIFRNSLLELLQEAKFADGKFDWEDFSELILALRVYSPESTALQTIQKWFPLAKSVKNIFLGENAEIKSQAEFVDAISWAAGAYGVAIKYFYNIRERDLPGPQNIGQWIKLIDSVFVHLETSPAMKKHRLLPADSIDEGIRQFEKVVTLSAPFTGENIRNLYRTVLANIIQSQRVGRADANSIRGIEDLDLPILKFEYLAWKIPQGYLNQFFAAQAAVPFIDFKKALNAVPINELFKENQIKPEQFESSAKVWKEWVALASLRHPLISDKANHLVIPTLYNFNKLSMSFESATLLTSVRSLIRLILLGYGEAKDSVKTQLSSWNSLLSEGRIIQLETDFSRLGRAVQFLDPRSFCSSKRTFGEGNFFAFSSNGDNRLNSTELVELFSILISGGFYTTKEIMNQGVEDKCAIPSGKDVFDQPIFETNCFRKSFKAHFLGNFSNLGDLVSQVSANRIQFDRLLTQLLTVAEIPGKKPGTTEFAEIRTLVVVLHYLEALYATFDANHDGVLQKSEILAAYSRFGPVIEKLSGQSGTTAQAIFLYLIQSGQKPDISTWIKKITVGIDLWNMTRATDLTYAPAHREELLDVFALIKNENANTNTKCE